MFVKPQGNSRGTSGRSASSLFVIIVGAVVFTYLIQGYMEHMMLRARTADTTTGVYGYPSQFDESRRYDAMRESMSPAAAPVAKEVRQIIKAQLTAFKHKDFKTALRYASREYSDATPADFENMVTSQYPQNANPRNISFQDAVMSPCRHHVLQRVTITGQDGSVVSEVYSLEHEDAGWHIRGVRFTDGDDDFPSRSCPAQKAVFYGHRRSSGQEGSPHPQVRLTSSLSPTQAAQDAAH